MCRVKISFILSISSLENIGLIVARGPGLIGLLALFEISLMACFCNTSILLVSLLSAELHN